MLFFCRVKKKKKKKCEGGKRAKRLSGEVPGKRGSFSFFFGTAPYVLERFFSFQRKRGGRTSVVTASKCGIEEARIDLPSASLWHLFSILRLLFLLFLLRSFLYLITSSPSNLPLEIRPLHRLSPSLLHSLVVSFALWYISPSLFFFLLLSRIREEPKL